MHACQFTKSARLLVCAVSVLALPLCVQAGHARDRGMSEQEAVTLLLHKLKRHHLYPWLNYECLGFIVEKKTQTFVDIAIREIHNSRCSGDPGTSPIVDRFRVMRSTANVLWYDFSRDRYASFAKARSQHK